MIPSPEYDLINFTFHFQGVPLLGTLNLTPNMVKSTYTNKDLDLTSIELKPQTAFEWTDKEAKFLHVKEANIGDQILVIQYPEGQRMSLDFGKITEFESPNIFLHSASTRQGSSGSPVLNQEGRVVGIHGGKFNYPRIKKQSNFSIKMQSILNALDEFYKIKSRPQTRRISNDPAFDRGNQLATELSSQLTLSEPNESSMKSLKIFFLL